MSELSYENPAVAGSGTIASGLAACMTALGDVTLLARSDESAWRAEEAVEKAAGKIEGGDASKLKVTTEIADIGDADLVVESVAEDADLKGDFLRSLGEAAPDADLATTTSSLSLHDLGERSGTAGRLYGLHVFNPVPRMELVELVLPDPLGDGIADRARALCEAMGKKAVEVPDTAGFVVNRLLFPYLFDAVRFMEETGLDAESVDTCMTLGTGQPMGPLRLLDFVGLDVSNAIGHTLYRTTGSAHHEPPKTTIEMEQAGKLGRKSGEGFYSY